MRALKTWGKFALIAMTPFFGELISGVPVGQLAGIIAFVFVCFYAAFRSSREADQELVDSLILRAIAWSLDDATADRAARTLREDADEEIRSGALQDPYAKARVSVFVDRMSRQPGL